jgi:hypothetical protein
MAALMVSPFVVIGSVVGLNTMLGMVITDLEPTPIPLKLIVPDVAIACVAPTEPIVVAAEPEPTVAP